MRQIRIQRKRIKGWKMPENTVYVGRPSRFGNPFVVGKFYDKAKQHKVFTASHAVMLYTMYLKEKEDDGDFWRSMKKLEGKNLACWCPLDEPCHADSLLKIVNG